MTTVAPLGSLMFRVTFRAIPTVKSLQLQSSPERQQADIQSRLQRAESQQPQSALHKLLDLHQQLQSAMPSSAAICYDGVETGVRPGHQLCSR